MARSEEQKARQRERFAAWYAKNRDKVLARRREHRADHADEINAKERERRKKHPRKTRRRMGPHPQSDAQWYYESVSYDRKKARMLSDPDYYARIREQGRRSQRKRVDKNRKRPFVERPSGRIPDYMTKREVAESARHSAFNWVNQSNDQARANAAFANQLYRERWGIDD